MTMETIPAPLCAMDDGGGLDEFRIHAPVEVRQLLTQLQNTNALLHLSTPDGVSYTTTLWTHDRTRGIVSFAADARDARLPILLESSHAVVVGYADNIKLQFEAWGLELAPDERIAVINAMYPLEVFRFQRRRCYRVRPLARSMAMAVFTPPRLPDCRMQLRVLDISLIGVALHLMKDVPGLAPGSVLQQVLLQLDAQTQISVNLMIRHVTTIHPQGRGARMGCEIFDLGPADARVLQRYVDRTQMQRRAVIEG